MGGVNWINRHSESILMNRHSRAAILLTCVLLPAIALAADDVLFVKSPHTSLTKTRQLLDAADLRLMLPRGYAVGIAAETTLGRRSRVVEVRSYNKHSDSGIIRGDRFEIAIVPALQEGYEFALYRSRNDRVLYDIKDGLQKLADRAQPRGGSTEPELGYEMLRLGHMDASRALSLLKALGYNTIEFSQSSSGKGGEEVFNLSKGRADKLPLVIKVVNAAKTSLLQSDGASSSRSSSSKSSGKGGIQGVPALGGSHLFGATTDAPEERLLLVYDRNEPEELEKLVNLLQSYIDVAAQQIVIEALVIEINRSELQDLGVEFFASKEHSSGSFGPPSVGSKAQGTFIFSRDGFADFTDFNASIEALAETGNAEVLSSPSVLVLNDRQARIQVGRQIPVSRTTATSSTSLKGIEYFPIGIVLNLRPRINRDNTEVAMQIETIISSISSESAARLEEGHTGDVSFSPIVDNRLVESYVRVADGTPFIIGGLLSTEEQSTRIGIPMLMQVPLLGRLFSREKVESLRREVIVVITPHIVPLEARNFSYLIPKDSDIFDRFDFSLFRNGYRVRDDEVWDLKFIQESPVLQDLVAQVRRYASEDVMLQRKEPFSTLLAGNIPGESVLVRRMLSDIISKLDYAKEIDTKKLFFFEKMEGGNLVDRDLPSVIERARVGGGRAVMITYDARSSPKPGQAFSYPSATVTDTTVPAEEEAFAGFFKEANPVDGEDRPKQWTIILRDKDDVVQLHRALILKRLLELNDKLPLTLEAFQPGLQIVFPSREDMAGRYHLIDGEVAQLFYETSSSQYYPAFERIFNRKTREIKRELGNRR